MGESTFLQLPLVGGLQEKTSKEWLDPSKYMTTCDNGNFVKVGAVDKRVGMGHLANTLLPGSNASAINTAIRTTSWSRSQLSILGLGGTGERGTLYEYSAAENGLIGVGNLPNVKPVRRPITPGPGLDVGGTAYVTQPLLGDFAYAGTTLRVVLSSGALTSGGNATVYATVYDADTGDSVLPPQLIYTSSGTTGLAWPWQVIYLPNATASQQLAIFILDLDSSQLLGCNYVASTNSFTAPTALAITLAHVPDIVPFVDDPAGGMIAFYGDTTTTVTMSYVSSAFAVSHTTLVDTAPATYTSGPLTNTYVAANYGASEKIWFYYSFVNGGGNYEAFWRPMKGDGTYSFLHASAMSDSGTGIVVAGVARLNSTQAVLLDWFSVGTGAPDFQSFKGKYFFVNTSGTIDSNGVFPMGCLPIGRLFVVNGVAYCPAIFTLYPGSAKPANAHSEQGTLFLLQLQNHDPAYNSWLPVATVAPRQVDTAYQTFWLLFFNNAFVHLNSASFGTRYAVPITTLGTDAAAVSGAQGPVWAVDFFFDSANQSGLYACNELGGELHIAGGVPMVNDTLGVAEDCFFYYPEFSYLTQSGSSDAITGTYGYQVVYTYTDSAGLLHRSAPFDAGLVTLTASQTPVVHIPALSMTWRDIYNPGQVYAEIYRTVSGGATFFLLDRIVVSGDSSKTHYAYGPDNTVDSDLQVSTLLYTTGGVLDQICPPTALFQTTWLNRCWIVDETLRTVWFSQAFQIGLAPGWNEALTFTLPDGGDITGLQTMDTALIIFKGTSIWAMQGQTGPAQTGQGSDLTIPQRIASDVGCIDWRSIVLTPNGVMFQAQNGIYLLTRSFEVQFVGKAVVDELTAFPVVTSATLVPSTNHARFTCTNAAGTATQVVFYDYLLDQWGTHSFPQLATSIASSTLIPDGRFGFATVDGLLWLEKPAPATPGTGTQYQDDDSSGTPHFVSTTVGWSSIQIQGVQGYQQAQWVQLFALRQDDCGLQMNMSVDNDPTVVQSWQWSSSELADVAFDQVLAKPAGAYCRQMSFGITFNDIAGSATATGQGARFISLGVMLNQIGPRYRQVAAARVG